MSRRLRPVWCATRLELAAGNFRQPGAQTAAREDTTLGGSWLAGLMLLARSPYLAGIALWVALLSLAGTFLYFMQANVVAAASDDPAVRTRIFATIDLAIGLLTLAVQGIATGRSLRRERAPDPGAFWKSVRPLVP